MSKLSVIVPCFNEEESLPIFYEAACRELDGLCELELYLIDDGSRDGTLRVIKELAAKDSRVRYISFSRNFGKEAALYAGLKACTGDYVVVADADMQDPPSLIPEMMRILQTEDYDCVCTRRVTRAGEPPVRSFFARCFYKLINSISSTEFKDGARDFRLMKRQMVDAILSMSEYNRFSKGLFSWVGFKVKWLEYENIERAAGTTKWSFWGLTKYAIDGIVAFSTVPLLFSCFFAVFLMLTALVMFICCLAVKGAPDWLPLGTLIVFCTAVLQTSIAILSLYFSKTYTETKGRPVYIVAEKSE
jgi:glycosyltransferase involved in cell wall biosynthesis